jgi:hypothetical protein
MGKNLINFIYLIIFQLSILIFHSLEIIIQEPQRREMNLFKFNPLEDFLKFNNDLEKMANAMLGKKILYNNNNLESALDDSNKTLEDSSNDNNSDDSNKSHRVHREVKRTAGNGFETIEITEIHIGGAPNPNQVIGMPLSGIIISKPKNLGKPRSSNSGDNIAPPFQILTGI